MVTLTAFTWKAQVCGVQDVPEHSDVVFILALGIIHAIRRRCSYVAIAPLCSILNGTLHLLGISQINPV
jgi:hypothetical protein